MRKQPQVKPMGLTKPEPPSNPPRRGVKIWPWYIISELEKEIDGLLNDATEMMFRRIVMENGNFEATIENKLLTKTLAEWARQIFEQYPEAKNYMSIQFNFHGEENYELIIQRVFKKTPAELNVELKRQIKLMDEALMDIASLPTVGGAMAREAIRKIREDLGL